MTPAARPRPRPLYRDPADILARLSLEEKIAMLHQHQPAVPRLGLAPFTTGCEALHGVGWIGRATVFPQAVGLGATWDRELLRRVGQAVSSEVRAFRQDTGNAMEKNDVAEKFPMVSLNVWAPVVNLLRDPRWGRNEEGYSEDPYATGEMAIAYCRGLRGDDSRVWRTAPLLKHFLAYNAETDRDIASATVPERVLREYELPAFRRPIEDGAVAGVMPGYNLVNGIPNHVHPLIRSALRAWDAELAVCSDAQAPSNLVEREEYFASHVESHAAALLAGIDSFTDNSEDSAPTIERFTEAFARALVTEADIDAAVGRVLLMRQRTGEFDPDSDPYAGIRADVIACTEHAALALDAARAAVVLLRNEDGVPPLADFSGAVAVIGHLGSRVLTDWYSGTLPYSVSIAEGLGRLGELGAAVVIDGSDTVVLRSAGGAEFGPFKHVDWGTSVQCPNAVHTFQAVGSGLYLTVGDDAVVEAVAATPDGWVARELFELEEVAGGVAVRSNATGRYLRVGADANANGGLVADLEAPEEVFTLQVAASGLDEAVRAAASAERVVLVVGNDPHINGRETIDRDGLALPPRQQALLEAVHAANPATTLVIVSSYPYAIDTAIPSILWTSHAGQELGTAVADVLTGAHNPSGRLPQTWYASAEGLPEPYDYDVIGSEWTYQYSRREHLWVFGHGLSYTEFEYSNLEVARAEAMLTVTVDVANVGTREGAEVVQLYTRSLDGERRPLRKLAGFAKVSVAAGGRQTVVFEVPMTELAFWDEAAQSFTVDSGRYEILVGASSRDIRVRHTIIP